MATLIQNGQITDTDPAYVGRWAGEFDNPMCEPDSCYFCPIGKCLPAIGFLTDGDCRHGICEEHKDRPLPTELPATFACYVRPLTLVKIRASQVRKGMTLMIAAYPGSGDLRLAMVTKVEKEGMGRRIFFRSTYHSVDVDYEFDRALSRLTPSDKT